MEHGTSLHNGQPTHPTAAEPATTRGPGTAVWLSCCHHLTSRQLAKPPAVCSSFFLAFAALSWTAAATSQAPSVRLWPGKLWCYCFAARPSTAGASLKRHHLDRSFGAEVKLRHASPWPSMTPPRAMQAAEGKMSAYRTAATQVVPEPRSRDYPTGWTTAGRLGYGPRRAWPAWARRLRRWLRRWPLRGQPQPFWQLAAAGV